MGADQAADPGEGVVLPHHLPGCLVVALGNVSQETGNVYAGRTRQMAGSGQQLGADMGVAVMVLDVMPEFIPEIVQGG